MSPLEERLRRLEYIAAIRVLDATCCRLLDDGDGPALVTLSIEDGTFDGLSRGQGDRDLLTLFGDLATPGRASSRTTSSITRCLRPRDPGDRRLGHGALTAVQACVVEGVPHVAASR